MNKVIPVVLSILILSIPLLSDTSKRTNQRSFEFVYSVVVRDIPADADQFDLWLPYPESDNHQMILDSQVVTSYPTRIVQDQAFKNSVLHIRVDNPEKESLSVEMKFRVKRKEHRNDLSERKDVTSNEDLKQWLGPDRLVPLDDRIRELAEQVTRGKRSGLEKARAIYDYVVDTMSYDKSGTGWGNGDIYWACDAKRGNCTDFHALFIGLCRASGIPAKFAIGFPLPADKTNGIIGGYHCWSEFYIPEYGWIPVDTSEAKKNPEKREYFFSAHDEHRMQFTVGRDIVLEPPQKGKPLNYFIYPYVEIDGLPHPTVETHFTFRDF